MGELSMGEMTGHVIAQLFSLPLYDIQLKHNEMLYFCLHHFTSIMHRIKNPLRRTSEHISIIYFQTFA